MSASLIWSGLLNFSLLIAFSPKKANGIKKNNIKKKTPRTINVDVIVRKDIFIMTPPACKSIDDNYNTIVSYKML